MYVNKYANMIQGALTKSPKSFDIVTKDVDTIDVSRVEIKKPLSSLSPLELECIGEMGHTLRPRPPVASPSPAASLQSQILSERPRHLLSWKFVILCPFDPEMDSDRRATRDTLLPCF
jgi:hypothetical protein